MPKTLQFAPEDNCPKSKPDGAGKTLLAVGAATTVAVALAIKAALPVLLPASEPETRTPLDLSAVTGPDNAVQTGKTASGANGLGKLPRIAASVDVEMARDPIHAVQVSASIRPIKAARTQAPADPKNTSSAAPKRLTPAAGATNSQLLLARQLAKAKLKRTLLAARAVTLAKAAEIEPEAAAPFAGAVTAVSQQRSEEQDTPVTVAALAASKTRSAAITAQTPQSQSELPMIDEELPAIDAEGPVQVASLAPTSLLPVPDTRPRPLIGTTPSANAKPGAIGKPRATAKSVAKDEVRTTKPAPVLAYAAPEVPDTARSPFDGLGKLFNGRKSGLPGQGSKIAVYDISAAVVHMPDGTKLEAHSGIAHRKDNPKYAHVKNLGPTPPNVYKLRMRERLFHGVEAIRMLPLDRAAMKGRDGMLTHSRLLRRSNGSHGCVAFKNYNKFLNAFKAGKIKTLIVVPSMEKLPTYMAMHNRSSRT